MTNNVVGANAKRLAAVLLAVALAVALAMALGAGFLGQARSASAQPIFQLTISKDAYPMLEVPYPRGTHIDFLITVSNNSPNTSPPVTLTDTLPGGVGVVSANAGQGDCTVMADQPTISCNLGALSPGDATHVNIIVTAETPGTYTNVAEALGNRATETITIAAR